MTMALWRRKNDLNEAQQIAELTASRREIVNAFEIERRRIERDLHDGTQQYIVAGSMALGEAQILLDSVELPPELADLRGILARAQNASDESLRALRQTVNGIHPKVLSDLGLEYAIRDAVERSGLDARVVVPHRLPTIPEGVNAAAYFLVTEALTNVAKYAPDAPTTVLLAADDDLHVSVVDAGPGGAEVLPGRGLAGLRERMAAFGGNLTVHSPAGGPTTVSATIPLLLFQGESAIVAEES